MLFWLIFLIIVGIFALYKGADILVSKASVLAARLGVSTVVIGLSVVALGGVMPELSIGITSSLSGANDLIIGNALGSSVLKVAFVFGIAALIAPISIKSSTLKREFPWLLLSSVVIFFLAFDLLISRTDAVILILLGILFQWFSFKYSKEDKESKIEVKKIPKTSSSVKETIKTSANVLLGLLLIIAGAKLFVDSSLVFAYEFGVSEILVGILIIAIGASIPELIITTLSVAKKEFGVAVGNIIGSNVMNIHLVVGVAALIRPLEINPDLLILDFPMLIIFTMIVSVFFISSNKLSRFEGALLVFGYVLYFIYSIKFWG